MFPLFMPGLIGVRRAGPDYLFEVVFAKCVCIWRTSYLFEVVFVKCVCIWRTLVFFQFYGVLSGVICYIHLPSPPPTPPHFFFFILFKVTLLQQRTVLLVT